MAGVTGLPNTALMRDTFLGPRVFRKRYSDLPDVYEQASPLLRITSDAPDFFVIHGVNDTLVEVGQARAFVKALRDTSKRTVSYAELPTTQHAFDIFPSIRSQHLVRATERFLNWHWNLWRREQGSPAEVIAAE